MTTQSPKIGDIAPDFEALTDSDETVKLSHYRGRRVVLYFYPKDNTSGCTKQACAFRDNYPAIEAQNAFQGQV
jgi:peroxiredoxin Q/BCP